MPRCIGRLGRLATSALLHRVAGECSRAGGAAAQGQVGPSSQALASCSRGFATNSTDIFNIHRHTESNNLNTTFDFTPENYERVSWENPHPSIFDTDPTKQVAEVLSRFPRNYKQRACIPLLDLAQQQNGGWLSLAAMNRVAKIMDVAPIRVYEVATFYSMFNRTPMGRYHVMVCGTTPCMLCGSRTISAAIKQHLSIDYGQTTKDGLFTLGEMECMGSCVNAPMIAIADYSNGVEGYSYNYYEDLTPADIVRILDELKAGKKPKVGSQHRDWAVPVGQVQGDKWVPGSNKVGKTLTFEASGGKVPGPYCRNLDEPVEGTPKTDAKGAGPPPPPPPPSRQGP